jgi:dGTP triphosphohydrolase
LGSSIRKIVVETEKEKENNSEYEINKDIKDMLNKKIISMKNEWLLLENNDEDDTEVEENDEKISKNNEKKNKKNSKNSKKLPQIFTPKIQKNSVFDALDLYSQISAIAIDVLNEKFFNNYQSEDGNIDVSLYVYTYIYTYIYIYIYICIYVCIHTE